VRVSEKKSINILKNKNIFRFSFEIQNYFVSLQRKTIQNENSVT